MRRVPIPMLVLAVLASAAAGFAVGSTTGAASPVWQADEAFNRSLAERNRVAFSSWIAEDAVFLGGGLAEGREAILERWAPFLDRDSGSTLRWQPHTAMSSKCEDLGYTIGDYVSTGPGPDGGTERRVGTYVSVWRRGADGAWRVVADAGPPPQPEVREAV